MPIYGYVCRDCEHTLDALQKISDAPLVDCPECGSAGLKRQLSAPRFRLKGQGWYETDFKSDNKRNLAGDKPDGKSDDKAEGKTDGKGDGKAADKSTEPKSASKTGESTGKSDKASA